VKDCIAVFKDRPAVLSWVHYLLIAPLHAAVPLRQVHQVAKVVTNNLHSTAQHSTAHQGSGVNLNPKLAPLTTTSSSHGRHSGKGCSAQPEQ
jgi:cytoskeletal protein RodZ